MDLEILPAGPNIAVLQQGLDLIRRLDDELYMPVTGKANLLIELRVVLMRKLRIKVVEF